MTDVQLAALWLGVLGAGVAGVVALAALGLATTYARDVLHIGAGVWILGWPAWSGWLAPVAIVAGVAIAVAAVPAAARGSRLAARIRDSVSDGDERWSGLIVYTLAYTALTAVGLTGDPFPAAAGLLALSLGDGIGGAVGRRFGRRGYSTPFGKRKTLEGSVAVAAAAAAGAAIAASLFGAEIGAWRLATLGAIAAVAEGVAPRGSDNATVPVAVWAAAAAMT